MKNSAWSKEAFSFAETTLYDAARLVVRAATYKDARHSIAWMRDLLFRAMSDELESQNVSRKVAADMLGMSPRNYHRLLKKRDTQLMPPSLWEQVFNIFTESPQFPQDIRAKLHHADGEVLTSIMADMRKNELLHEHEGMYFIRVENQVMDDDTLEVFIVSLLMKGRPINHQYISKISGRPESAIVSCERKIKEDENGLVQVVGGPSLWISFNAHMMNTSKFCHTYLSGNKPDSWRASIYVQPVEKDEEEFFESMQLQLESLEDHALDILNSVEHKDRNQQSPCFRWQLVRTFGDLLPLEERE